MKSTSIPVMVAAILSGATGLGYELVWCRMFASGLGAETPAVLAVLAAFFGGSALGAWLLDSSISSSRTPARWYGILEGVICCWAVVLVVVLPPLGRLTSELIGISPSPLRQWLLSFTIPFISLLPATVAMGGSLVALERILALHRARAAVPAIYALNTFGAVAGAALATHVVFPAIGFSRSLLLFAGGSFLCTATGFLMSLSATTEAPGEDTSPEFPARRIPVFAALFFTGFLGVGYEVLMVRSLSQVLENTAYSFTSVLIVYLLGTAFGAWLREHRRGNPGNFKVLLALSCASLAGTLFLRLTRIVYYLAGSAAHGSLPAMIGVELLVAAIVLLLPAVTTGFTFCHLALQVRRPGGGFGWAIAVNTAGGTIAPIVFGVLLLPAAGLRIALAGCACAYCAILFIPGLYAMTIRRGIILALVSVLLVVTGSFLTPGSTLYTVMAPNERILASVDGAMATSTVIEDPRGGRHLLSNSRFPEGGTTSLLADGREAVIPILLHPAPHKALFLGVGAGVTLAVAHWFDSLDCEGVELVPEMKSLLPYFLGEADAQRITVTSADARRFAANSRSRYDVVVADLYHPSRDGTGLLYTVEHFSTVKCLLDSSGLFCQWLPLYQMNGTTLRTIVRTFTSVFPHTAICFAYYSLEQPVIGLVGSYLPISVVPQRIEMVCREPLMRRRLESLRFYSTISLAGSIIGVDGAVERFAGAGPLNTDDLPKVLFDAPAFAYGKGYQPPHGVVEELLASMSSTFPRVMKEDTGFAERVTRYCKARDRFLRMGIDVVRSPKDYGAGLHIDSLLACVQLSPDFEAAYNPLIGIAIDLAEDNREKAEQILDELASLNPKRTDAVEVKKSL